MSKLPVAYPTLSLTGFSLAGVQAVLTDLTRSFQQIAGVVNNPDNGPTTQRPTQQLTVGQTYFDTTLGAPVWWNGTQWIAAAAGGSNVFTTLYIGGGPGVGYELYVDGSGNLVIGNPNGTSEVLVTKS
jgi:hypothetical protein